MSAVPKKKLCWNCEGNVARDTDNCPYCGVYVHSADIEEDSSWNPSYKPSTSTKQEEIPSPLYQIPRVNEAEEESDSQSNSLSVSIFSSSLFSKLKVDLFPSLFLMMGSIFFLFGIILLLFSKNGTLTLQWQSQNSLYFLISSFVFIGFGWKFLQNLENKKED